MYNRLAMVDELLCFCFFFFKQKTAYELLISDWSSDVCSSDLTRPSCQRVCRRALRRVRRAHQRSISEEAAGAWTADGGPSSLVGWVLKKKQRAQAGRGP